jgi:hypothetical protein
LRRNDHGSIDLIHVDRRTDVQGTAVRMTLRYSMGEEAWTHTFSIAPLDESSIAQLLREEDLGPLTALDTSRRWFSARLPAGIP